MSIGLFSYENETDTTLHKEKVIGGYYSEYIYKLLFIDKIDRVLVFALLYFMGVAGLVGPFGYPAFVVILLIYAGYFLWLDYYILMFMIDTNTFTL